MLAGSEVGGGPRSELCLDPALSLERRGEDRPEITERTSLISTQACPRRGRGVLIEWEVDRVLHNVWIRLSLDSGWGGLGEEQRRVVV